MRRGRRRDEAQQKSEVPVSQTRKPTDAVVKEPEESPKRTEHAVSKRQRTRKDLAHSIQRGFARIDRAIRFPTNPAGAEMKEFRGKGRPAENDDLKSGSR